MPTAQEENAVAVTVNSATQESTLGYELELSTTNVETDVQKGVDSLNNSKVTSGSNESLVSARQLQSMLAAFMTAMQAENAKLASNLESKLNKLTDNLATVFDRLDAKTNLMIAKVTSEMRRENYQIRQEFSMQLQTEVQLITKEVVLVRNSTDTDLTNCVQILERV